MAEARADAERDRAERAEAKVNELHDRLDAAQAEVVEAFDAARVATEAADAARVAEGVRRARNRWARLKAAWRGV